MRRMKEQLINVVRDVILVEVEDMNYCHPFNMPLLEERQVLIADQFYSSLARQLITNALLFYYSKTRKEEMVQ